MTGVEIILCADLASHNLIIAIDTSRHPSSMLPNRLVFLAVGQASIPFYILIDFLLKVDRA